MKFKKIEISAFRIYDKAEHATFDFSLDGNATADFVSLYAPNGYGKTSFYDAVEWGMTNNIQRFWQNKTITIGAIDALKNQSDAQVKLWRNIHSSEPTYVKIIGDGIEPIDRHLRVHGNKKSDADMDGGESLENRTFRNVILSQEWISAFLREIDGVKRYEIFMDNPELMNVNSYYKNLKTLLSYCQNSITSIDQRINNEQKRISALESENILKNINQQIDILTEKFKQPDLHKLTLATSKEDVSRLKNQVVDRLISTNEEVAIRKKIEWISAAKIGNDDYISIRSYFNLEARNKAIEVTQRRIRNILDKFVDSDKKTNEITALNKLLAEKETFKKGISVIMSQFKEYLQVSGLLSINESRLDVLRTEANTKADELSCLEIQETETRSNLKSALAGINQNIAIITGLPERLLFIQRIEKEIADQIQRIAREKDLLKPFEAQFKDTEDKIQALEEELADINKGNYSKKLFEDQVLASSIELILINCDALTKNEEELNLLTGRITQQEALNSEISTFVRRGLEIVNNDRNRTTCPLCVQAFKSHQELAQRIANNNALDTMLKELFTEKNRLEQESAILQELANTATGQLQHYFEGKVKDKRFLLAAVSDNVKTLNRTIVSFEENLNVMENDLREVMIQQFGLSNIEYERELKNSLVAFKQSEERLNSVLKKQTHDKIDLNDLLAKLRDELKLLVETIATHEQSEQYLSVLTWFRINSSTEDISFEVLQNKFAENDGIIKEYFGKVSTLRTELESLELEMSTFNQQVEKERINSLNEEKERADIKMDGFRSLLKDKLEIESQFIDFNTLAATLDNKEQGFNVAQLRNKSLIDEYIKVEKYADHINEFLQSENAKIALELLATDKVFLEQNVHSMLSDELAKTKTFLQEKVKEFFFEDLINDLYCKIDPHPDLKEVHFSADFDLDTPRLDVFVRDKVNKQIGLVPSLYFSTAQINILSLSIFLATALNTPGYDCIFIDDPIQSMDSVNILSTIDLLRSIVLNYNKQIILSTHDETFFNLLKKKMPAGLFKSKFIELENVGKVKA